MEDGGLHISVYRKFRNVAGSGARRKPGQPRHIEIIGSLQFGNGWSTEGSTYPCVGNSRMWLPRAPDGSRASPDTITPGVMLVRDISYGLGAGDGEGGRDAGADIVDCRSGHDGGEWCPC